MQLPHIWYGRKRLVRDNICELHHVKMTEPLLEYVVRDLAEDCIIELFLDMSWSSDVLQTQLTTFENNIESYDLKGRQI